MSKFILLNHAKKTTGVFFVEVSTLITAAREKRVLIFLSYTFRSNVGRYDAKCENIRLVIQGNLAR